MLEMVVLGGEEQQMGVIELCYCGVGRRSCLW